MNHAILKTLSLATVVAALTVVSVADAADNKPFGSAQDPSTSLGAGGMTI
ncbi:MAG: hypothetical protein ACREUP_09190 [Burkholderiales bacterium]